MSAPDALASIRPHFVPIFVQSFLCILKLKPRDILSSSTFPSWHFLPGYTGGDLSISEKGWATLGLALHPGGPFILPPTSPLNPAASGLEPIQLSQHRTESMGKKPQIFAEAEEGNCLRGNPDIACKAERFG